MGPSPGNGHGECFIWKRPSDNKVVAIDAGGAASVGKHAGTQSPEILILSHDDGDHIRGAVSLIKEAKQSLQELWVPAEWAILIKQIADTDQETLRADDVGTVNVKTLEQLINSQITTTSGAAAGEDLSVALLSQARATLTLLNSIPNGPNQGLTPSQPNNKRHYYGAKSLYKIIQRVIFRAEPLIAIFNAALDNNVQIRFFSIDLALSKSTKEWETAGAPGTVTLANATEAPHALALHIPPGLAYTYALSGLTIQNRRALCTLLWNDPSTPDHGTIIWSDTDGNWLDHTSPLGLNQVIKTLSASSAPHHASAKPAHKRVWAELNLKPNAYIMISAGGQHNQGYQADYNNLKSRRCCTLCRPTSPTVQEVKASSTPTGAMTLHHKCLGTH